MRISVSPGSGTTESVTCVVENPTVYEEKISITVDAGNLTYSAPGSIIVQGGSSESFELVVVAQERMSAGSHTVNVEVSVQEIAESLQQMLQKMIQTLLSKFFATETVLFLQHHHLLRQA